jgi:hypothetical protein
VAALAYFVVFAGFAHIRLVRVCQHFLWMRYHICDISKMRVAKFLSVQSFEN